MPWLRLSDLSALHPLITKLIRVRGADERTTNEVSGFLTRCAAQSAAVMEDYWFDVAIAQAMAPTRWEALIRQAREAGLVTKVEGRGLARRFRLVELPDELWHIRYRSDVEWVRQRDRDRRNPDLTLPALLRDGDVCRYCSRVVLWGVNNGAHGGTYDHVYPGQAATLDTFVVACRGCNSRLEAEPHPDQLLPIPARPHFSPGSKSLARLGERYGAARLAELLTRPEDTAPTARPSDTADALATEPKSTTSRRKVGDSGGGSRVGSGRAGSGGDWSGGAGAVPPPSWASPALDPAPDPPPARPRGRRGRGRRGTGGGS